MLACASSVAGSRVLSGNRLMPMEALTTSSWPAMSIGLRMRPSRRLPTCARLDRLP